MQKILYKKAKNGKTQQWSIEVSGAAYRTSEGYVGGAITTTEWTNTIAKRVGASNATSAEQQAIKEAEAKVTKQLDKGWVTTVDKIDAGKAAMSLKPMLAKDAKDGYLDRLIDEEKFLAQQPKLDGIRAVGADKLYSRNLKVFTSSPHILAIIYEVREYLGMDNLILDGELYNHEYHDDFNELSSLIKKQKPSPEQLRVSAEKVQYHIFDVIGEGNFSKRNALVNLFVYAYQKLYPGGQAIQAVDTIFVGRAKKHYLDKMRETWLADGYEGDMIRDVEATYEADTRSKSLVKRKEMQTEEFELMSIEEGKGNRAGVAARVYCKTKEGNIFKAGIKGNMDYCRDLLKNKAKYIGKQVTIQFQNYTPDNIPRFTKMLTVRDYE